MDWYMIELQGTPWPFMMLTYMLLAIKGIAIWIAAILLFRGLRQLKSKTAQGGSTNESQANSLASH